MAADEAFGGARDLPLPEGEGRGEGKRGFRPKCASSTRFALRYMDAAEKESMGSWRDGMTRTRARRGRTHSRMSMQTNWCAVSVALWSTALGMAPAAETPRNISHPVPQSPLPLRVHVFEDYETDIEKRWWLRGALETNNVPPALSASVPNRRACRATQSKDFDDKMGDPTKSFKAVVFNPVPGPPMGPNTRLSFRYWLDDTDTLRVQIYSLSKGYHRFLTLTNLPQRLWESATVDMTAARRPDGSGGPLAEDERIDDIQFYVAPEAELIIDDIVLCEAAPSGETKSFPHRVIFTGWFDTGKQGASNEWPGDFEIVKQDAPFTWKAAKSVVNPQTGRPWIRVHMRGARPLSAADRLRFRYRLTDGNELKVVLANSTTGQEWNAPGLVWASEKWTETTMDFQVARSGLFADELRFVAANNAELLVDDLLLFEPAPNEHTARLETDALQVVVADNEAFGATHRAGYNGVAELLLAAPGAKNLFVASVAGLNFEHIFNGDAQSFGWNIFEPRRAPMQLVRRTATRVELQQVQTEHWPLRSRLTYEVTNDAIDFTYCGMPLVDAWRKHGYIGVFFASYIDKPEDMSLQFIGRSRPGRGEARPRWIKHLPPKHGEAANHRPAGSTWDPPLDEGFNIPLAKGTSDFEYVYPFYFGRSGENVFIMMFERPRDGGELRFAQSPSGGGTGNPAWDFLYFKRGYEMNREFCFRARAVFRKFKDAEEVIRVYEQWSGEKVVRPEPPR